LPNTVGVTENNPDLGGGESLLGKLADEIGDLIVAGLEPSGSPATIGDGRARNTLSTDRLVKLIINYTQKCAYDPF
jgi:hypothetical protein